MAARSAPFGERNRTKGVKGSCLCELFVCICHGGARRRFDCQTANAPPARLAGGGCPSSIFCSVKKEGSRTPTGADAEAPHPMTVLADRSISGSSARDDRPLTGAGAPLGALLRRSHYGGGPRFRRWRKCAHRSSASSWQEAIVPPGGAPTPPGCEGANLARGRRSSQGPELPGAGCRSEDLFSGPASGLLHAQDAS